VRASNRKGIKISRSGLYRFAKLNLCDSSQQDNFVPTGSFRVTQKIALRATTAAPTFFKPLLSFDELYCDGGIVASNPSAVAVHEARAVYPGVPLELLVSIGTGGKGT
jgi:hypothetical protein